mmetsp:Transcript_13654/g.27829  ORF Transcript_13654/g.27829 Transcript_13654/m.27829 type:complete len:138 (+) Transcript_13654:157-570(+)
MLFSVSKPEAIPTIERKLTPEKIAAVMNRETHEFPKHLSTIGTSKRVFKSITSIGIFTIPPKNEIPLSDEIVGISPTTPPSYSVYTLKTVAAAVAMTTSEPGGIHFGRKFFAFITNSVQEKKITAGSGSHVCGLVAA